MASGGLKWTCLSAVDMKFLLDCITLWLVTVHLAAVCEHARGSSGLTVPTRCMLRAQSTDPQLNDTIMLCIQKDGAYAPAANACVLRRCRCRTLCRTRRRRSSS